MRTKKEIAQKATQKKRYARAGISPGKCAKVRAKKEFCNTITRPRECNLMTLLRARQKALIFPGWNEFLYTIRAGGEIIKNLRKLTQKRVYEHDYAHEEYQDILDTLKSRLLKNTNIRGLVLEIANAIHHIGRVPGQIGRTPGQAAAVSSFF